MLKIGLLGCGNIGSFLAEAIDSGKVKGRLVWVFDMDSGRACELAQRLKKKPKVAKSFDDLLAGTQIIVEAASQKAVKDYGLKAVSGGKSLLIMSAGAMLDKRLFEKMTSLADKNNVRIYIPSGAVCGIDGIKSASAGVINQVLLQTTKPPNSLRGYEGVKKQTTVFFGPAAKAVELFPANVNVSAVLSLAGLGAEKTLVRLIADPKVERNIHEVFVSGSSGDLYVRVDNVPSPENPKTSFLACLSAIRTLNDIGGSLKIGT